MRIVIDTNVLISGVFFGGFPRKILSSVVSGKLIACATTDIINEYEEIVQEILVIKEFENIQIITAKEFCEKYLFE